MNKPAALYARVSSDRQKENHTIASQVAALTQYAETNGYLFREEYIFEVEKAVVVETPELGHATYVFAKPRSMDAFLALYTKITKDDIRRNRNNAAERLGFLGRVIHGTSPRAWLREVRQRVGEGIDFAAATAE